MGHLTTLLKIANSRFGIPLLVTNPDTSFEGVHLLRGASVSFRKIREMAESSGHPPTPSKPIECWVGGRACTLYADAIVFKDKPDTAVMWEPL